MYQLNIVILQGQVKFRTGGESPRAFIKVDPVEVRSRQLKSGWEKNVFYCGKLALKYLIFQGFFCS